MESKKQFLNGIKLGLPIGLGYLSVSFTFGIMATSLGLKWWQALLISMCNLTSAGQLAGVTIMVSPFRYFELLLSQFTINLRYSFMSISLSQKADKKLSGIYRLLFGFFVTDEIFAVASGQKKVTRAFMSGVIILPYLCWSAGTLFGAIAGNILPTAVTSALCIAIYGMFVAIVAPDAAKSKPLLIVVGVSAALSCAFYYLPYLNKIPEGISISVCAVIAAVFGAALFPVNTEVQND